MTTASIRALTLASVAIYVASLTQVGFYMGDKVPGAHGYVLLMLGWLSILTGGGFSWLANPLLLAGWFCLSGRVYRGALVACLGALTLMGALPLVGTAPVSTEGTPIEITSYGPGYWLWIISAILGAFAGFSGTTFSFTTRAPPKKSDTSA